MKKYLAERFDLKHDDLKMIDSEAEDLQYMLDNDGKGIVISGALGMTGLTVEQAQALAYELPEILEVYF